MKDDGFFGPDSVAWRIHADPSALVSGIRSLMLQSLHPRAMAGVAEHSSFRTDFWGRLRRTSDYLLTVVYGTRVDAERASDVVRAVHARVRGIDSYTGLAYAADDPELLGWVANATVDSYLTGYRLYGKQLSAVDADRYVAEMRTLGVLMGVDEATLPENTEQLRAYFADVRHDLAGSPFAREGVRVLLKPGLPLKLQPLWGIPAVAALSSLPGDYQRMLGFPFFAILNPGVRVSTGVLVQGLRFLLPPPPAAQAAQIRSAA